MKKILVLCTSMVLVSTVVAVAAGETGDEPPEVELSGGIDTGLDCIVSSDPPSNGNCAPVVVHFDDEPLQVMADVTNADTVAWYWDFFINKREGTPIAGPDGDEAQPAVINEESLDAEDGWFTYFLTYSATNENGTTEEYLEVRILPAALRPMADIAGQDEENKLAYPFELDASGSTFPGDGEDPRYEWTQSGTQAGEESVFTVNVDGHSQGDLVEVALTVVDGDTLHGDVPSVPITVTIELDLSPAFGSSIATEAVLGSTISPTVDLQFPEDLGPADITYEWELDGESIGTSEELVLDSDDLEIDDVIGLTITVSDGDLSETAEHEVTVLPPALGDQSTSADSLDASASGVTYTFGFNLTDDWPADGAFVVAFPSGFSLVDSAGSITGCDGDQSTSAEGRVVTVTRTGDATDCSKATEVEVEISGVVNRDSAGSTGGFQATLRDGDENPLMRADFPSVTLVAQETDEEEEDEPDPLRPDRVTDLEVVNADTDGVTLRWTAPEAKGEPLTEYRIGASNNTITTANFAQAVTTQVEFDPSTLAASGETQRAIVSGLDADTVYHFAVQAEDADGNRSQVSNVVDERTEAAFDPIAANKALQTSVTVRAVDDGMEVSWNPETVPDTAAGLIVWRINSPATFAGLVQTEDPAYEEATFVDADGTSDSGYILTLFYGMGPEQGYNTESLSEIASLFETTEEDMVAQWGVARAQTTDGSGSSLWLFSLIFLVVLAVIAGVLFYYIRMHKEQEVGVEPTPDAAHTSRAENDMDWAAQPLAQGDAESPGVDDWSYEDDPTEGNSSPARSIMSPLGPDDWSPDDDAEPDGPVPPEWPDEERVGGQTSDQSEEEGSSA